MAALQIGLIGSGWRAEFFLRVAAALPSLFTINAVMIRDKGKGRDFSREHNVPVVHDLDQLTARPIDCVVLSIARGYVTDVLKSLVARDVPVLCETPPGETLEELLDLWRFCQSKGARVRVAEQYPSQPLYQSYAEILRQGLLGEVDTLLLSALHGYHAVSIFRRLLGTGFENAVFFGARHTCRVVDTLSRQGLVENGDMLTYTRERLTLAFEGGRLAFYDFSDPAQYHSMIRGRQWSIQGTRGEIDDMTVRYLADGIPVTAEMARLDFGNNNNHAWSHYGYSLGERVLYRNPFYPARLNDDEIAVAACMRDMAEYLHSGNGGYALSDALQDAYFSILMKEAANSNRQVASQTQPWAE